MPLDLELNFPGVTPSRQKRSRETTSALLKAGAEMLRTHRLEDLSIEGLCAEVGATVGAFYSRFDSKDAYFNTLLGLAARDGNALLTRLSQNRNFTALGLEPACAALVQGVIDWMRAHEGVIRAALHRGESGPPQWNTFKELGGALVAAATPLLLRAMGGGRRAAKVKTIGFGFQVIFGTLVNAILNSPGPLSLHDKDMATRLSRCLVLLLEAEMSSSRAVRPASGTAKRIKTRDPGVRKRTK